MKAQIIEITQIDGSVIEHIILTEDDINFTSMPKSVYDAQLAAQGATN